MTSLQSKKLSEIKPILNHWENTAGDLVIETTYGTKRFQQIWIGKRGGFCGAKIYKNYDYETKKPYNYSFSEQH